MNAPEVNGQIRNLLACQYALRRVTNLNAELLESVKEHHAGLTCTCNFMHYIGEKPPCQKCKLAKLIAKAERGGL